MIVSGINDMYAKSGFNIRLTGDVENSIRIWHMIVYWNRIGNLFDRQSIWDL
jgi:hypothetical protein